MKASKMYRAYLLLAIMLMSAIYSQSIHAVGLASPIPGPYMPSFYWKHGAIFTRALALDNGHPQYVEIDGATGAEVGYIGSLASPEWQDAWQTSADTFLAYQARYQHHMTPSEQNADLPKLMSVEAYNQTDFFTIDDKPVNKQPISAPYTHVLVVNEKRIFSTSGEFLILDKYQLDPSQSIAGNSKSLLVDPKGQVIFQSPNNIGFRVGFYGDPSAPMSEANKRSGRESSDEIFGPLAGVPLQMGFTGGGVTDEKGKYTFTYLLPPCPGFSFHYTTTFWATMYYQRFNPHHDGIMPYVMMRDDYDFCMGYEVYDHRVIPIKASLSTYKPAIDFPVDLIVLNGFASVVEGGKNVPIGSETRYESYKESGDKQLYRIARQNRDYDSDGTPDTLLLGGIEYVPADEPEQPDVAVFNPAAEEIQGVWLSGSELPPEIKAKLDSAHALQKQLFELRQKGEDDTGIVDQLASLGVIEIEPDFTRQADWSDNFDDFGKLAEISKEDLLKTDIYVVRSSNGELVYEREGIPVDELDSGIKDGRFNYTVKLRGGLATELSYKTYQDFSQWQIDGHIQPKFQQRQADHLRAGELVEVYAINRVTGYMGVMPVRLKAATGGSLLLSFPIDELKMTRPNLKVWSTRKTRQELGLNQGQIDEYLIGNEGAGLTQDMFLALYTEWTNQDGSPIPAVLSDFGYTARLASLVDDQVLGEYNASSVSQFSVLPGIQLQALMLFRDNVDNQRFYVQVHAKPEAESPDFSSTGRHQGKLGQRPDEFVPFKVPVFDEDATSAIQDNLNAQKSANPDFEWYKADPIYHYVYRPEYQFSQYTLQIDEINRKPNGGELENIINQDLPVITATDELLDLLHLIAIDENLALDAWAINGEQELIFDINGLEVKASVNQGTKQVTFDDLSVLSDLSVEDFISIRLFANNDSANILWEYAFEYIFIHSRLIGDNNETKDTYYVTADNPVVELKAGVLGYANRSQEDQRPYSMFWSIAGDGNFSQPLQPNNNIGIFDNTLVMPSTKGAKGIASVSLREGGASSANAQWKTVEVLAGKPASITIEQSANSVVTLGQSDVKLTFTVRDGSPANNLVEDGTAVSIQFADSLVMKEHDLLTKNGVAYAIFTGGEFAKDETVITASVGEGVTASTTLAIEPLTVTITPEKSTLNKRETTEVSVKVTTLSGQPAAGVPVSLSAGKGLFKEQELITDAYGQIKTTFTAGLNEVSDKWVAQAGFVGIAQHEYEVKSPSSRSIDAQDTMLLADKSTAGILTMDAYGVETTAGYEVEATVNVRGEVGDTLSIGDMADPNLEPLVSITMNQINYGYNGYQFNDGHGFNPGLIQGVTLVNDHPLGGGRSAAFLADSTMTVTANALLDFRENIGFRLDIKPLGEGQILDYASSGLKLSYYGQQLELSVGTSNGRQTLKVPATLGRWHSVAAKATSDELVLYVNGETHTLTLNGALQPSVGDIAMGGLDAVIRGFRVYDYSSLPLITFADGSTRTTLQSTNQQITVKSQGNLGKLMLNSQLKSLRVALITDTQRNYASLLTTAGYQEVALKYLFTVSPQRPTAQVGLPLGFIMSSAHAWSWDSVWEGVKTTVSVFIPYEDFIIIGEQLVYLYNQDWENFDATTLAFASIGAATIIPVAKPLKPLLGPIKKVVDGMRRFPGSKHFAGAMGTAAKAGLSGKTEKLVDMLPFILIAVELYEDPEIFEFFMSAIQSEDDLWVWVEYIAEVVRLEGGLDVLASQVNASEEQAIASLPLSYFISAAHAGSTKNIADKLKAKIRQVVKAIDTEDAEQLTSILRDVMRNADLKKIAASGTYSLRLFASFGGRNLQKFVANSKDWRVNRWLVMFSVMYLVEEYTEGRLQLENGSQITALVNNVLSNNISNANGAVFQIVQTAYYHALHQGNSETFPKVIGIDTVRPAYYLTNGVQQGNAYARQVDILLEKAQEEALQETWVELKSYSKSTISGSIKPTGQVNPGQGASRGNAVYREFFHDYRLNRHFITQDPNHKSLILEVGDTVYKPSHKLLWLFQDFKVPNGTRNKGQPPTPRQLENFIAKACKKPTDVASADLQYNFSQSSESLLKADCEKEAKSYVELRNTRSYFTELLDVIGSELAIAVKEELLDVE
ncbi:hypothetical protein [Motilimonas eburnea]|uniref:hypothetical protein n=1 Tax=Motilimonas eburnea TaxID=1737488 RepID=UPI001E40274D|nr:hypothetical protein [Motilimonas eburnea]MCE2572818.1 hypothetical protein [Motilimonas eburnea]